MIIIIIIFCSRIPNILNKQFSNVGNILASKLPPAERPFTEYLRMSSSPEFSFHMAFLLTLKKPLTL